MIGIPIGIVPPGPCGGPGTPPRAPALLREDGGRLLRETGGAFLLE
jgi:hypothetical protein